MGFKFHEDSFLTEYSSNILTCEAAQFTPKESDTQLNGYNVTLEDTILFPEGGGQPCDYGLINGKPVMDVVREGKNVIHFVQCDEPFQIGETAVQKLDWFRRLDHMQQHSGQHLISAIFENDYGFNTTKWCLSADISFIELDAKKLTADDVKDVERKCNEFITKQVKVYVSILHPETTEKEEITRLSRGLPKDQVGPLRVINIEGIDRNMCCGTHVTNLAQLQMIKLVHFELAKGKYLVYFLVGNRILSKLDEWHKRELEMNLLLNCGPQTHLEMVTKIKDNLKTTQRALQKSYKELATEEAKQVNQLETMPKFYFLHRKDGLESEFLSTFIRQLKSNETLFFLTSIADDLGKGHMILKGPQKHVESLANDLCEILDGKGNQNPRGFQGKFNKLKGIRECENKIKEYFKSVEE